MSNSGIIGPRQLISGTTASGINTLTDAQVLKGADVWPSVPNAPTNVSATSGGNTTSVVSFTASTDAGSSAITGYRVTSTPSGLTATGSASPITITGLTNGTSYTFTVAAQNAVGFSGESTASGSITPVTPQQVAYTSAGTYSFVVPAGLNPNKLAVVLVGAGGGSGYASTGSYAGGGGGLRYRNNITAPSAGTSISVVVGAPASWNDGNPSTFGTNSDAYYLTAANGHGGGYGGAVFATSGLGGGGTTISGDVGGGNGGSARYSNAGGGGAGGYSGNGGDASQNGSGGGGGGGENGSGNTGGGGGVGLLGQGSNGDGGSSSSLHGKGGSGGADGTSGTSGYTANGGLHGGGAGGNYSNTNNYGTAGTGGARIIYSTTGLTRAFPTTQTGDV